MSNSSPWRKWMLRYEIPPLPSLNATERVALMIGTGMGVGFVKPLAPSWASIPGFALFILGSRLPLPMDIALWIILIPFAIWSGTVCERLLGKKDPRPVVIDEIAAVPFALWPLWMHWPHHWMTWLVLFAIYRIADFIKPWPADNLQSLSGGTGILLDDLISSTYVAALLTVSVRFFPMWV